MADYSPFVTRCRVDSAPHRPGVLGSAAVACRLSLSVSPRHRPSTVAAAVTTARPSATTADPPPTVTNICSGIHRSLHLNFHTLSVYFTAISTFTGVIHKQQGVRCLERFLSRHPFCPVALHYGKTLLNQIKSTQFTREL